MSITNEDTRIVFVGDGVDNSPYAGSFPLRDDDDVEVIYVNDSTGAEVVKVKTTDYTIALAADRQTFTLTLVTAAPATGETLLIRRDQPATQETTYELFDGIPAAVLEGDLDKQTYSDLTLQEQLDRCIKVPKGHPDADLPLTPQTLIGNAGKIQAVNAGETDVEWIANVDSDGVIGPASSTNNAVVRWDGTTGLLVQDSGVFIDDSNQMTGVTGFTCTGLTVNGGAAITGTITAGSGANVITTAAGLVAHAKIDPAIAGTGITNTAGVLSVVASLGGDVVGPGPTVTDETVWVADGTGGLTLKETAVVATVAGAVSGITTLGTSGLATLASLGVAGTSTLATVDINGGNIDGTEIGAAVPAAITGTGIVSATTTPALTLNQTDAGTDQAIWNIGVVAELLRGAILSDDLVTSVNWIEVQRSGTGASIVVDSVAILSDAGVVQATFSGAAGSEVTALAGDLQVSATGAKVTIGDLTNADQGLLIESLAGDEVSGLQVNRLSNTGQHVRIGSFTNHQILGTGVSKKFVINNAGTTPTDIEIQIGGTPYIEISNTGVITMVGLAGTGSRTVVASATGVLSAP